MVRNKSPFYIGNEREGLISVCCNLPLAYFAGGNAETLANHLVEELNKAFDEIYPELIKSMQAADEIHAALAKRKWSHHMYLAVEAVLETQRDSGQGPMDWQDIYLHPDFRFPLVIGSVFGQKPLDIHKVRKSIQGAVRHLQIKGVDVEVVRMPGRGLCYSLC